MEYVYRGKLEEYCEQGCGCSFQMHDDRGLTPNPNWPKESPEYYHSPEWCISYKSGMHFLIFDDDGVILFDGLLHRDKMKCAQYQYNFIPKEVEFKDWWEWHRRELNCEIRSDSPSLLRDRLIHTDFRHVIIKLIGYYPRPCN